MEVDNRSIYVGNVSYSAKWGKGYHLILMDPVINRSIFAIFSGRLWCHCRRTRAAFSWLWLNQ